MARGEGAEQCAASLLSVKPLKAEIRTEKVRSFHSLWMSGFNVFPAVSPQIWARKIEDITCEETSFLSLWRLSLHVRLTSHPRDLYQNVIHLYYYYHYCYYNYSYCEIWGHFFGLQLLIQRR